MKKMEREKDEMDLDRKIDKNVCKEIKNIDIQKHRKREFISVLVIVIIIN